MIRSSVMVLGIPLLLTAILFTACKSTVKVDDNASSAFVKVDGNKFIRNGKPYFYMGANYWCGMNLGVADTAKGGNRSRLLRELDQMKALGITNLRIMAITEGPDNSPYRILPAVQDEPGQLKEELLVGLDFFLAEMQKREMTAIVCLNNFWPWSGGMGQYLQWSGACDTIPYPPPHPGGSWNGYQEFIAKFYSNAKAVELFNASITKILNRTNSITGKAYKEDPTIMAWELCNEPRGVNNTETFNQWIDSTAGLIKKIDPNHLVTTGSEGITADPKGSGVEFDKNHDGANIDYTTAHIWIQNWQWYDPAKHDSTYPSAKQKMVDYLKYHAEISKKLGKPYVLEEFGIMRDQGSFDPMGPTKNRDTYYQTVFEEVYQLAQNNMACGVNFWAWGGEGRPRSLASWWKKGDDLTGDPPHEPQGWYSVNNTDTSTHRVIKMYAEKMNGLVK